MNEAALIWAWTAAILMCVVGAQQQQTKPPPHDVGPVPPTHGRPAAAAAAARPLVRLTMCQDNKCHWDCQIYVTPLDSCFSSANLFPNDPSWSDGWDILDTTRGNEEEEAVGRAAPTTLHRLIFSSKNGTCVGHNPPDSFDIPLDFCVGPFGAPRPWGTFELLPALVEAE